MHQHGIIRMGWKFVDVIYMHKKETIEISEE